MPGKPSRKIYLHMKTVTEAQSLWRKETAELRSRIEEIPTTESLHRVLAEPVFALGSVPHYHGAAMDGIAVKAEDTFVATEMNPLKMRIGENAFEVDTGDALPESTDAVIMVEYVEPCGEKEVLIRSAAFPWQHVRKVGEDIVAGELMLPQHHCIRPADMGAMLAAGVSKVSVFAAPRVLIQPTGTELLPAARALEAAPGQIIEFNGTVLSALVKEYGGEASLQEAVPDDFDSIKEAIQRAVSADYDIVLVNAGSSAGSEDYSAAAISELGKVLVHGVTMMPGKPTILGMVEGKPVVGIPGYPVSAILAFEEFVRPLLYSMRGLSTPAFPETEAILARKTPSRLGLEEFVRVIVGRVNGKLIAMPLQRGAGVITSLTRADGILRIPQEVEGKEADEIIKVRLLRPHEQLDHTLIMIGSHDNTIDLIANELKRKDSRLHLSSSNVGSLGGLLAIRRGQAHLAGSHLLDTQSGEYNRSYIEKHLKGQPVRLVKLAYRQQGLLVRRGNPKQISGISDLARPDVTYVNRQAGAGTRILLDYCLQQHGISPGCIRGYEQEEFTHMAVAISVLSGRADTGMAIFASAKALQLDFIPIAEERYDLVIPDFAWYDPKLQILMELIQSSSFRQKVMALGGYEASDAGTVLGLWDGEKWA